MDGSQFDALTRSFASRSSRRRMLKGLLGAVTLGVGGVLGLGPASRAQDAPQGAFEEGDAREVTSTPVPAATETPTPTAPPTDTPTPEPTAIPPEVPTAGPTEQPVPTRTAIVPPPRRARHAHADRPPNGQE